MKSISQAIVFVLAATAASRLLAQPYQMDKNGNGTTTDLLSKPPIVSSLPFEVAPDPTGGITNSPVLIYSLEFPVISGDVALLKTDGTIGNLLRFYTPPGQQDSLLIFYSQTNDTASALADVGIPGSTNPVEINEVIPKTHWVPGSANQPGYPATGFPVFDVFAYTFVTQSAPPVSLSGTNLVWDLTDEPTNLQFRVLATTNLSMAITNWSCISTDTFDASGNCVLTLPMEPDKPRRFYNFSYSTP